MLTSVTKVSKWYGGYQLGMGKANNKGKITVGRPRPDFIDRCQPPADAHDPIFGMSNYTICTTPMDTHMMIDGFKSFPSGHSSCKEKKFRRTKLDDQHEINMDLAFSFICRLGLSRILYCRQDANV